MRPAESARPITSDPASGDGSRSVPADGEAYRFEIGGGHWIFGGDPVVLRYMQRLVDLRTLRPPVVGVLSRRTALRPVSTPEPPARARARGRHPRPRGDGATVRGPSARWRDWLVRELRPDAMRPVLRAVPPPLHGRAVRPHRAAGRLQVAGGPRARHPRRRSARPPAVGYNVGFVYPAEGLDALARRLAEAATGRVREARRSASTPVTGGPVRGRELGPLRRPALHAAPRTHAGDGGHHDRRRCPIRIRPCWCSTWAAGAVPRAPTTTGYTCRTRAPGSTASASTKRRRRLPAGVHPRPARIA